ncbi:MAG: 4Fe-4S binding protein [Verrucomicrobia bacterium]|nr:4Fe-4S binding protein [Verrucomicrobiota bacterium]
MPVVDEDLCTGCAACVEACGPKSLEIVDRVAVLVRPDTCGSEEHCIAPCPTTAIQMAWVEMDGDKNRGKWRAELSRRRTCSGQPRRDTNARESRMREGNSRANATGLNVHNTV